MTNAASAINSFLPAQDACSSVSQSEDPVFILSSAQLQEIITKAIQPLKQEIAALRDQLASLEKDRDVLSDNQLIQLKLINELRGSVTKKEEPQPLQKDRGEILRALIVGNGGKMLAKDARQKMRLDKSTFSRLLDTLKDDIDSKPLYSDKRRVLLIIK